MRTSACTALILADGFFQKRERSKVPNSRQRLNKINSCWRSDVCCASKAFWRVFHLAFVVSSIYLARLRGGFCKSNALPVDIKFSPWKCKSHCGQMRRSIDLIRPHQQSLLSRPRLVLQLRYSWCKAWFNKFPGLRASHIMRTTVASALMSRSLIGSQPVNRTSRTLPRPRSHDTYLRLTWAVLRSMKSAHNSLPKRYAPRL